MLLARSGWRSGILLNILWGPRQSPLAKNYPASNVSSTKVEKLCCSGRQRRDQNKKKDVKKIWLRSFKKCTCELHM